MQRSHKFTENKAEMQKLLSQSRFPSLWMIFQFIIGGTVDKRKLCMLKYENQKRILEVGCSLGNIASAFKKCPADYTGVDIDPIVINYANKKFCSLSNFHFHCIDIGIIDLDHKFDYIILAGVLHHIDDKTAGDIIRSVESLSEDLATIVIVDPLLPQHDDPWLVRNFTKLERGQYLRDDHHIKKLIEGNSSLMMMDASIHYITGTPFPFFKCARFGVFHLKKITQ